MTDDFEIKFMTERLRITIERSEAAENRIEELEAKLAKLTKAATKVHISYWHSTDGVITGMYELEQALRLGELRGEDRG